MENPTPVLEEKLVRRNSPLPEVRADLRQNVLAAAREAVSTRRRRRQQMLAVAAGLCIACLSVWRISVVDRSRTAANQARQIPAIPGASVDPKGTATTNPPVVPPVNGNSPAMPIPPGTGLPGGMRQGPVLGLMGAADPRAIEEQLMNRQNMILRVLKPM